jgi:Protein of unknown function (DUF2612)
MKDVKQTIISQYGNSPTIRQLILDENICIDPRADIDGFFNFIWNVDTAQGFGLDIWGRIVGVSRQLFSNSVDAQNDDAFRQLILLKALSNISASSSPSINKLLTQWMAGRGRCYVSDIGNMLIIYQFEFLLQPFEIDIITNGGIFLRPAGVGGTVVNNATVNFGFREGGNRAYTGFNQAPFVRTYAVS